jgi:hypothetical protein
VECRYKIKRAYQNTVRATKSKMKFSITASDLTPTYTPANSLATTHGLHNSINAVRLQPATERKTVNVKFQVKKMNRRTNKNENGVGNEIFTTTVDAHENGVGNEIFTTTVDAQGDTGNEIFTTTVDAQGDTGANCSATNTIDTIHNYRRFEVLQNVGVFSGNESSTTLQALGEGVIKILSDQGSIMEWTVLYTPLSSGTVLSPDNYHSTHKSKYYAFYHMGTSESTSRMGFLDYNQREVESIQMKRTHNGEWLTTNQVLVASPIENIHMIRAISRRSDRIPDLQKEQNDNMQAEEDQVVMGY